MKFYAALILALLIQVSVYALKPSKHYEVVPDTLKLPHEKNVITTSDGLHLKSWTFLPTNGDKRITLVMAYADAGNMSWWVSHASLLSQFGYTVVLFDYRGFGESDNFRIENELLYYNEFQKDLNAAMDFARKKYPKNKTGIWAFSMGSIITTLSASGSKPAFIIADGLVTSPIKLVADWAAKGKTIKLPADAGTYESKLAAVKVPMLVFSGNKDQVTTDADAQKLKKTKLNMKIVNFDGGHMMGLQTMSKQFYGSEYIAAIDKFLGKE